MPYQSAHTSLHHVHRVVAMLCACHAFSLKNESVTEVLGGLLLCTIASQQL